MLTRAQDGRGATVEYAPEPARFDTLDVAGTRFVRVSVAGAVAAAEPGQPALPAATIPIAVPEGMDARLQVLSEEWDARPGLPPLPVPHQRIVGDSPEIGVSSDLRFEPDPRIYGGGSIFPAAAAELGAGSAVGSLWSVPIVVRPVRYEPRAGSYRVLRRMTLRVDFVPDGGAARARRPFPRPGQDSEPWRRVQQATVRNFEAARAFPSRGPTAPRLAPQGPPPGTPELRIRVSATGFNRLDHAALTAGGVPAGTLIRSIALWERYYDETGDSVTSRPIPVVARDSNADGILNAGDAIGFYGRGLGERFGPGAQENRYADANVYWVTWGGSPADTIGTVPGALGAPAPARPASFRDSVRLEQNLRMIAVPVNNEGSPPENIETFFWTNGSTPDGVPEQFETPVPFIDVDPAEPVRIRARYQGQSGSTHRLSIFLLGSAGTTDTLTLQQTFPNQSVYVLDTGFTIPGAHVAPPGTNRYRHIGERQAGGVGSFREGSRAWLDWVEATYSRSYRASGDALSFRTGVYGGIVELRVEGFSRTGVEVYDVTDPTVPVRVAGVTEEPSPGPLGPPYAVTFQTDATAGERRFVAFAPGAERAVAPGDVMPDAAAALDVPSPFPSGAAARAIVIAPDAFLTPANRLADYRRGQGYVVEVARIEDVYDEFGGGIKSPFAIRRYLRHAFLNWTPAPAFVVLAGDASMDYKHHLPGSGADWIPTYLKFETIPGPEGNELVAHDSYYTIDLTSVRPTDASFSPSVFLGRIPASSAGELDQYVTKAIQYESFQPTDTWRSRQLLVSDDEYSSTIYFNAGYCHQPPEALFRISNQDMGDAMQASRSGQDLRTDFFDLKTYTDPIPTFPVGGNTCRNLLDAVNAFRTTNGAVDQLHASIAQGALIVNVQAHANRYLIAHEQIYITFPGSYADRDRLSNFGRPVYFMVWGCHANQFADSPYSDVVDSTDSIGEQWLMLPNTGSIASFGSSGYELLNTNGAYNAIVSGAFYSSPPPIPPPGTSRKARWILGEVMGLAALRNANVGSFLQQVMNRTLNLAGDPMLRMDALPPRVFEVTLDGAPVADGDPLATSSPTDSLALVAKVRDETALKRTDLAERSLPGGGIAPLDSTRFTLAVADSARENILTARVRPRAANYDLLVRAVDTNDRESIFTLPVRTAVRYYANGTEILSGVFAAGDAVLRAEITAPIPLTADSLELVLDGSVIFASKTPLDGTGRRWALESLPEQRGPGSHTVGIALGGRTAEYDTATYSVDTGFTLRGVAVVSPRAQGQGCDGSIFQYELSAPARSVRLLLMTVSGRRVASIPLPGVTGYNVACWDGRDSQGHPAATGLYLFRLTATDAQGRTASSSGRMIRSQ